MKRFYQGLAALLMMMAVQEGVFAQTNNLNVTTTAVPFLRISPDARAGGMGDLGVATSPDPASTFYNQSKIPFATEAANNAGKTMNHRRSVVFGRGCEEALRCVCM